MSTSTLNVPAPARSGQPAEPYRVHCTLVEVIPEKQLLSLRLNFAMRNAAPGLVWDVARQFPILIDWSARHANPVVDALGRPIAAIAGLFEDTRVPNELNVNIHVKDLTVWTTLSDPQAHVRAGFWGQLTHHETGIRSKITIAPQALCLWREN